MQTFIISFLLFLFLLGGCYLVIKYEKFNWKCLVASYIFVLTSMLLIEKYDYFKFAFGNTFVEFRKKVEQLEDSFLSKLDREVQKQKESIELLISTANQTKNALETQRDELKSLIEVANTLKNEVTQLNEDTNRTKRDIENLNKASEEVVLTVVRNLRNEFGPEKTNKAIRSSKNDIDKILTTMEVDPSARKRLIERVKNELSSGGRPIP